MASKRRLRRKACTGKRIYADMEVATLASQIATKRSKSRIMPYKCQFGGHIHIGHPPREIRYKLRLNVSQKFAVR